MGHDLLEIIAEGEAAITRRQAAGKPVPPDWTEYLQKAKAEAARLGLLPAASPLPIVSIGNNNGNRTAPRYTKGCLYDFVPGRQVRPTLKCVSHPGCPREVVLWRPGILAEMFTLEKLVGTARKDGEAEWMSRRTRS